MSKKMSDDNNLGKPVYFENLTFEEAVSRLLKARPPKKGKPKKTESAKPPKAKN
jgi:hypothetical protein